MAIACQQAKVREYLRTHDVDASACAMCDGVGSWTSYAHVDDTPFTAPAHVECEDCDGSGVVGVDARIVREALQ